MKGIIHIVVLLMVVSCGNKKPELKREVNSDTIPQKDTVTPQEVIPDSAFKAEMNDTTGLIKHSRLVLYTIKKSNIEGLYQFIHPTEGVRLSPYSYINIETDRKLLRTELLEQWSDNKKYRWGIFDGSGEPIVMTCPEYFERFVYSVDFYTKATVSLNKTQGSSNSGNNLNKVYKGLDFVDYYFPGSDPALEGMDYESLRLVYKKENGEWWLVGIVHNEWTI